MTEYEEIDESLSVARVEGGFIPTLADTLCAYVWKMGGSAIVDTAVIGGSDETRNLLAGMLFPCPTRCETLYELRSLITKIVIADGLWSGFTPGKPFTEYLRNEDTQSPVYSMRECHILGELVNEATRVFGPLKVYEVTMDLIHNLVMPH